METIVFIFATISQLYIAIAASIGKLKKESDLPYPKNLTPLGWSLIISCLLCLGLTLILYLFNRDSQKDFENKLEERDRAAENKRIESNKELLKALAEYNLQYSDSLNKIIQIAKDSSRNITNNISEIEHSFKLDINPISLDSSIGNNRFFRVYLRAFKGEIYNININLKVIKRSGNEYSLIESKELMGIRNDRATEGETIYMTPQIYASPSTVIYFYVFGSYTNSSESKKYPVDEICLFDFSTMTPASPNAQAMLDVRAFLKSKGIIRK